MEQPRKLLLRGASSITLHRVRLEAGGLGVKRVAKTGRVSGAKPQQESGFEPVGAELCFQAWFWLAVSDAGRWEEKWTPHVAHDAGCLEHLTHWSSQGAFLLYIVPNRKPLKEFSPWLMSALKLCRG